MQTAIARSALLRLVGSLVIGAIVGAVVDRFFDGALGVLVGVAAASAIFDVIGWIVLWPMDAEATRQNARREVFRASLEELVIVAAASAALVSIVALLVRSGAHSDPVAAVAALAGVFTAWAGLHLMYAARYAFYYYSGTSGGIDFNQSGYRPAFRDFFYFSYNLGMTYQVSDTSVTDPVIRAVALRHCLLSYVFGTGILATAINLVIGMFSG